MISGECRVEPIGLTTGHQLALEGLRLRLDLRIVPGAAAAAEGNEGAAVGENGAAAAVSGVPASGNCVGAILTANRPSPLAIACAAFVPRLITTC